MAYDWQMAHDNWRAEEDSLRVLPHEMTLPPDERSLGDRLRQVFFYASIVLVFAVFVWRLWQLQIVQRAYWAERAEKNRSRLLLLPALRGIVYDRHSVPLVHNVPNFIVTITPGYLPELEDGSRDHEAEAKIFERLSELLEMPVSTVTASASVTEPVGSGIKDLVDRAIDPKDPVHYTGPYRPVVIKSGVDRDAAMIIFEESSQLPGVGIDIGAIREYPQGSIFAPLMGYMAGIPPSLAEEYEARGYDLSSDWVGLAGIEYVAEDDLRGEKGYKYIEEDVAGREVRVIEQASPVPGHSVYLSIDVGLQVAAYEALQAQIDEINWVAGKDVTQRGAVVAMNPQTGEVLALVSLPSYDNNLFARKISWRDYQLLSEDPHRPLMNHAIADMVQPGSTFKIIVASAGLQEEVITARTRIFDPGTIVVPNKYFPTDPGRATRFSCWHKPGHGYLNVVEAIAQSCNIFFYETGGGLDIPDQPKFEGLGPNLLAQYAESFGLGEPTGIDLPGEAGGHVPTPKWKRLTFAENWSTGDTYNYAIGEGYLQVTPIQMLNAAAAIANGGTLYRPQVIHHVTGIDGREARKFRPQIIQHLPVSSTYLSLVQQGMEMAVESGTSVGAQVPGVRVAGKTGTAEFCDDLAQKRNLCDRGHWPTHAWFIAFAPVENPEIVLIVYIWNGGEGSEQAIPVAKKILDYYFAPAMAAPSDSDATAQ